MSRLLCTCWKAGVSMMLSRIQVPIPSSSTLTRKQARQPQARNASSGSRLASMKAPEARNKPPGTPMWAKLPKKPRRRAGANSTASSTARRTRPRRRCPAGCAARPGGPAPRRRSGRTSGAGRSQRFPVPCSAASRSTWSCGRPGHRNGRRSDHRSAAPGSRPGLPLESHRSSVGRAADTGDSSGVTGPGPPPCRRRSSRISPRSQNATWAAARAVTTAMMAKICR